MPSPPAGCRATTVIWRCSTTPYSYLRQFTPDVLKAISFTGGTGSEALMEAVAILKKLNAEGARKVPDGAPTDFVPAKCAGYLEQAAGDRDVTAYRHFWELTVLLGLRDGLRSGDVYVPSSRWYADPASYLFTPAQWAGQRAQFCQLVGKTTDARLALEACKEELAAAMGDLEKVLGNRKARTGEVRLSPGGELIIPPLSAEDIPAEAAALKEELSELLPLAPIASLLVELDRRTGFLDCFTHAGGKQTRSAGSTVTSASAAGWTVSAVADAGASIVAVAASPTLAAARVKRLRMCTLYLSSGLTAPCRMCVWRGGICRQSGSALNGMRNSGQEGQMLRNAVRLTGGVLTARHAEELLPSRIRGPRPGADGL